MLINITMAAGTTLWADDNAVVPDGGQNLWDLILQGGWAMWPLGGCSVLMFFILFYCWKETARNRFVPDRLLPGLRQKMQERAITSASELLAAEDTVLSRSLLPAMQKANPQVKDANKEKVETLLVENLEAEENAVGQWVNYLNVVAAVAPMIGLLGTVSGMISAFQTISMGGMGRPELLAGDIGEALITTATGLVVGIPAMISYFVMKNRLGNRMIETLQTASGLIDDLAESDPLLSPVNVSVP